MGRLQLWFVNGSSPSLLRASYRHPSVSTPYISERGRGLGAAPSTGSFTWSTAVQALAVLLVRAAGAKEGDGDAALSGEANSLAASLDYAIGKRPAWLLDFFGSQEDGTPNALRLLKRVNPERRRPGPVSITISSAVLSSASIEVFCDGKALHGEALERFRDTLESSVRQEPREAPAQSRPESRLPEAAPVFAAPDGDLPPLLRYIPQSVLHKLFFDEARGMLWHTDTFSKHSASAAIRSLAEDPSFSRVAGSRVTIIGDVDRSLSSSSRLGTLGHNEFGASLGTLRFAVSPAHIGTICILLYLRHFRKLDIRIDFSAAHSVEMARRITESAFPQPPAFCTLTVATMAFVAAKTKCLSFSPFMLMPSMTHAVLAPRGVSDRAEDQLSGRFMLMQSTPSTELFCFEGLLRSRIVRPRSSSIVESEPYDVAQAFAGGDVEARSIIGFPYYALNQLLNQCTIIEGVPKEQLIKGTVMLASKEMAKDAQRAAQVNVLIRDAWLALRESDLALSHVVSRLVGDHDYMRLLGRVAGVTALRNPPTIPAELKVAM